MSSGATCSSSWLFSSWRLGSALGLCVYLVFTSNLNSKVKQSTPTTRFSETEEIEQFVDTLKVRAQAKPKNNTNDNSVEYQKKIVDRSTSCKNLLSNGHWTNEVYWGWERRVTYNGKQIVTTDPEIFSYVKYNATAGVISSGYTLVTSW